MNGNEEQMVYQKKWAFSYKQYMNKNKRNKN